MDFAKKTKQNTKAHCGRKPSALLQWPVDPQIKKGVKWHIVESGHRKMRQFTDNHLLLTKTEHLKLCVCTSCQYSTNLR